VLHREQLWSARGTAIEDDVRVGELRTQITSHTEKCDFRFIHVKFRTKYFSIFVSYGFDSMYKLVAYANSLLNERPMTIWRISVEPAPMVYSWGGETASARARTR